MDNNDSLLKWALENRDRGCNRKDMRKTAINDGWNSEYVDKILSQAFDGSTDASTTNFNYENLPGLKLFNNFNYVKVRGQEIKIALTSKLPRLIVFENFLSVEECDLLIELSEPQLTRSSGVNPISGVTEITSARTSSGTFFRKNSNPLIDEIDLRIAELLDWPVENSESLQILRYEHGEQYIPHHDYFHEEYQGSKSIIQHSGNRVGTFLMYLATPEQGGTTTFPESGLDVYPQKGNAVFFLYPTPTTDTKTLHGGSPVILGEKYVATKWLRRGKFD